MAASAPWMSPTVHVLLPLVLEGVGLGVHALSSLAQVRSSRVGSGMAADPRTYKKISMHQSLFDNQWSKCLGHPLCHIMLLYYV